MHKFLAKVRAACAGVVFASLLVGAHAGASEPIPAAPWPATDALGRSLPVAGETGVRAPRADRYVGVFYFLWHDAIRCAPSPDGGPYDVSRILAREPDALQKPKSPLWGPMGVYHYWSEPLYGYYRSDDPWVIRRHAGLLAAAGVDVLVFDATNAETYPEAYRRLCAVFEDVRKSGGRTPGIAFMVNTKAGETVDRIYKDLYQPGHFRDLWFLWDGKPLLLCDPKDAGPEAQRFFTLRRAHWPLTMVNTPYAWHWEATHPQPFGYTDDPKKPEQVSVSVAQNLRVGDGQVTGMSAGNARGRSFHDGAMDRSPGAVDRGPNFDEQWRRALALDPSFVLVTGWNEWVASRLGAPDQRPLFVDQFDREFSRDIEPMKGGHGDTYYYQLVANVRRYKGVPPIPRPSAPRTIRLDGGMDQWVDVAPEFTDAPGDTAPRDFPGAARLRYRDDSGRNDIVSLKVARDDDNVYFYARTREPLTPSSAPNWMWLFLDTNGDPKTGWEGYDFVVNRRVDDASTARLERNAGGWNWSPAGTVAFRAEGNELHLAIPRASLGLPRGKSALSIDFKWADNLRRPGDPLDFSASGDAAPEGRFRYRYAAD